MKRNLTNKKILLAAFALTVCNVSFIVFSMNKAGSPYQSPEDANLRLDLEKEGVKLTSSDNGIVDFMVKKGLNARLGERYSSAHHAKYAAENFEIIKKLLDLGLQLGEIGHGEIDMYFSLDEPSQFIKINKDNILQGAKVIGVLTNLEDNEGLDDDLYGNTDMIALATYYSRYLTGTPIWDRDVSQQKLFFEAVKENYDHIVDETLGAGSSKKTSFGEDQPKVHSAFKTNLKKYKKDFMKELKAVGLVK